MLWLNYEFGLTSLKQIYFLNRTNLVNYFNILAILTFIKMYANMNSHASTWSSHTHVYMYSNYIQFQKISFNRLKSKLSYYHPGRWRISWKSSTNFKHVECDFRISWTKNSSKVTESSVDLVSDSFCSEHKSNPTAFPVSFPCYQTLMIYNEMTFYNDWNKISFLLRHIESNGKTKNCIKLFPFLNTLRNDIIFLFCCENWKVSVKVLKSMTHDMLRFVLWVECFCVFCDHFLYFCVFLWYELSKN